MDITITRQPAHRHNIVLAAFQQNTMRSSPSRRQKLIAQIVLYPPIGRVENSKTFQNQMAQCFFIGLYDIETGDNFYFFKKKFFDRWKWILKKSIFIREKWLK